MGGFFSQNIITLNWKPYNYEENGEVFGFSTEIVRAIMQEFQISIPIPIQRYPTNQIHKIFKEGNRIMLFSVDRNLVSEQQQYKWNGPIIEDTVYFYKKSGNTLFIKSPEDAKSLVIICPPRGTIKKHLDQEDLTKLVSFPVNEEMIQKFILGDADPLVCGSLICMYFFLQKANLPVDALEQTPVKLLHFSMYIQCTSDIPDVIIQQSQSALEQLKTTGKRVKVYQKYLSSAQAK